MTSVVNTTVYFMGQCYVQQWDVTKYISFTQVLYLNGICVTMCSYLHVFFGCLYKPVANLFEMFNAA